MTDTAMVTSMVEQLFNLRGILTVEKLNSYSGLNFLIQTKCNERFVLKLIPSRGASQEAHDCQLKVMQDLRSKGYSCPKIVAAANGKYINKMTVQGFSHCPAAYDGEFLVTLLEFIPGVMLRTLHPVPYDVFHEGGQLLAKLHELTKTYKGDIQPLKDLNSGFRWSLQNTEVIRESLSVIDDEDVSAIISSVIRQFEDSVTLVLHKLPCGIIHGDYNDDNIIVRGESREALPNQAAKRMDHSEDCSQAISGVIDFSDMTFSCLVFDIAKALSFMVITDVPDIVETIGHFVRGYSSVRPLTMEEQDVLLICLLLSLAQNLVLALDDYSSDPSNEYLLESVGDYPVMLRKLFALHEAGSQVLKDSLIIGDHAVLSTT